MPRNRRSSSTTRDTRNTAWAPTSYEIPIHYGSIWSDNTVPERAPEPKFKLHQRVRIRSTGEIGKITMHQEVWGGVHVYIVNGTEYYNEGDLEAYHIKRNLPEWF